MGNVDIEEMKLRGVLCEDNNLDKVFLVAVQYAAKSLVYNKKIPEVKNGESSIGHLIKGATFEVLAQLEFSDDCIEEYTNAVVVMMERVSVDKTLMKNVFNSDNRMLPYG